MDIRIMDDYRIMESPRPISVRQLPILSAIPLLPSLPCRRPISVEKMTINRKKRKAAAADGRLGSFSHHPRDDLTDEDLKNPYFSDDSDGSTDSMSSSLSFKSNMSKDVPILFG